MEHTTSWEHMETGITLIANKQENQKKKKKASEKDLMLAWMGCVMVFPCMLCFLERGIWQAITKSFTENLFAFFFLLDFVSTYFQTCSWGLWYSKFTLKWQCEWNWDTLWRNSYLHMWYRLHSDGRHHSDMSSYRVVVWKCTYLPKYVAVFKPKMGPY